MFFDICLQLLEKFDVIKAFFPVAEETGCHGSRGAKEEFFKDKQSYTNLKQMIEDDKLIIQDLQIISELSTFIVKGQSFEADDGCTDDLVACLFMFAWATDQTYFKELTDMDIRQTMMREQQDMLEQDMAPFGFVVNGLEDENVGTMVDEYGTRWSPVVRSHDSDW